MRREAYAPRVTELDLFVPSDPHATSIRPGSAIVGEPSDDDRVLCYYEGGSTSISEWSEKVAHASGRLAERYPVVSRALLERSELVMVGRVGWSKPLSAWIVTEVTDRAALEDWTGSPVLVGPTEEQKRRAAGIIMDNGRNMKAMMAFEGARRAGRDPVEAVLAVAAA